MNTYITKNLSHTWEVFYSLNHTCLPQAGMTQIKKDDTDIISVQMALLYIIMPVAKGKRLVASSQQPLAKIYIF